MYHIDIYLREDCDHCDLAKSLFDAKGILYSEVNVDSNETLALKVMRVTDQRSVPQIVINNTAIGDLDALKKLDKEGRLDRIVDTNSSNHI